MTYPSAMEEAGVRATLVRERERIIEERDRLEGDLRASADEAPGGADRPAPRPEGDARTDVAGIVLRQIEDALARLEVGAYATCATCGGRIAPTRLEALPYATRCIDCARRAEERP